MSSLTKLKVAELKDILTKASVSFPSKATKSDLIAKITATPAALQVYNERHNATTVTVQSSTNTPQTDDLLAPPEEVDWNLEVAVAAPEPKKLSAVASKPSTLPASVNDAVSKTIPSNVPAPATTALTTTNDEEAKRKARVARFGSTLPAAETASTQSPTPESKELMQRQARAARFGLPLVEPSKSKPTTSVQGNGTARPPQRVTTIDDPEKLKARAERFGTGKPATVPATTRQKRAAPTEEIDLEELERRKKRAERFGLDVVGTTQTRTTK